MPHRRTVSGLPFWAMLAALWALLVLGAAPPARAEALCGAPERHHAQDCLACCPCTLPGPFQALAAAPPGLPAPRGAAIPAACPQPGASPASRPAPATRARSPPASA